MAFNLQSIQTGKIQRPKILMLYAPPGIGKTTAASKLPNPIFIATEDGNDELDVARFPKAERYESVIEALTTIAQDEHDFQTLVIDSLSALEPLIHARVCADNNVSQIEKIGYGKGPKLALEYWAKFWEMVEWIRNNKGMTVVLIAHPEIAKVPNPDGESFDGYKPLLNKDALELFKQNCDAIFFANFRTLVRSTEKGFGQKEHKGIGTGERVMYTNARPTYVAKNRAQPSLPDEMPLDLCLALDYWSNPEKYAQ